MTSGAAGPPAIEVHVADEVALVVDVAGIERAVHAVLASEAATAARISVAFVGDAAIADLNQRYLGHPEPTDVISFPLHGEGQPPAGDIYIGAEQAARQAEEAGVSLEEELLRLAIHGTLHVLGYDHPEGDERYDSEMFLLQEALLAEVRGRK